MVHLLLRSFRITFLPCWCAPLQNWYILNIMHSDWLKFHLKKGRLWHFGHQVHLHLKNVGLHTTSSPGPPETSPQTPRKHERLCNTKTTRQRKRATGSKMWSVVWCGVVTKKTQKLKLITKLMIHANPHMSIMTYAIIRSRKMRLTWIYRIRFFDMPDNASMSGVFYIFLTRQELCSQIFEAFYLYRILITLLSLFIVYSTTFM